MFRKIIILVLLPPLYLYYFINAIIVGYKGAKNGRTKKEIMIDLIKNDTEKIRNLIKN